jgi:hypothetical protein
MEERGEEAEPPLIAFCDSFAIRICRILTGCANIFVKNNEA